MNILYNADEEIDIDIDNLMIYNVQYVPNMCSHLLHRGKPSMQRTEDLVARVAEVYPHITVVSRREAIFHGCEVELKS